MKIILFIVMFFSLFNLGGSVKVTEVSGEFKNITDSFNYVSKINIINNNEKQIHHKGESDFEEVLETLNDITEYSHDMPAFGVSIDKLTREEVKTGQWLELEFDKTYSFNEMPFEKLLIKIEKDIYGFNLIRYQNGKYEGRCFYLSLNGSMNKLYNLILDL